MFGAVEALLPCGGVNLTVVFGLVDSNAHFVLFGAAGDGDAVVEAGPLALSVFEFLDGEWGVVGLSVDGDTAFADPGLGDVEVVGAGPVLVALQGLGWESRVLGGEDEEAFGDKRGPVDTSEGLVVGDGPQTGSVLEQVLDHLDEGVALGPAFRVFFL
ncbi:hypothetical protein [Streptomyces sp. NPDC058240]|uniref:hypothetical protein n=1 Tax=Streptomyces sp. NPDC058240 TaxID=3346396 RepID=UPI0036E42D49